MRQATELFWEKGFDGTGTGVKKASLRDGQGCVPTAFQGKMGMAEEALFLASDDSSSMTASDVLVDGGFMSV